MQAVEAILNFFHGVAQRLPLFDGEVDGVGVGHDEFRRKKIPADRIDRRFVVRASISLLLACAAMLWWLSATHRAALPALFLIAALLGVARAFYAPATNAIGPNLVPPEVLPSAIATNSIAGRIGAIVGPSLAGYLYSWLLTRWLPA